jgi:tetratricopeptide (TPR) repeat protein
MIGLKDWGAAVGALERFRTAYPGHPLQPEVSNKLAIAYMETGQLTRAAAEFEALVNVNPDPQVRRAALWQVADLYERARNIKDAERAFQRYLQLYPAPLEQAVEARYRLAQLAERRGSHADRLRWLTEIVRADEKAGKARTDRTRFLAASASLTIAQPVYESYKSIRLVEPLKKNLKRKKERMQEAIRAYGFASESGVAEIATASTYHIADIYNDFGQALLGSQRPKGLSAAELEQYNVLLEEQAYPFEEKAIEIHELNARRAADGVYDEWVKNSFSALARLRPVRYAKAERSEGVVDATR